MYWVVDIGGTKIRAGLYHLGQVSQIHTIETPRGSTEDFLKILTDHLFEIGGSEKVQGLGVASAGPINYRKGEILNPANLGDGSAAWKIFPLRKLLEEKLKMPVVVDNDAAMTAWGYFKHREPHVKDLVLLTVGTGIGVGAVVDGQKARGGQGMHPELGHLILGDQRDDQHPTHMGNFPTLESYLSGYHFSKRVGALIGRDFLGEDLIRLSREGDPVLLKKWSSYAKRMAVALANIYLVYFPQKMVLAGGFAKVAEPFYKKEMGDFFNHLIHERLEAGMSRPEILVTDESSELPLLGAGVSIKEALATN